MELSSVLSSSLEEEDDDDDNDEDDDNNDIELFLEKLNNQLKMTMKKMMNLTSCQPMWILLLITG